MFAEPDWSRPIDFEARIAAIPLHATVRGMFLQMMQANLPAESMAGGRVRPYVAFSTYPMREYVALLASLCTRSRPGLSSAECVRRLGRTLYPNYAKTITGTAIFAVAGGNFRRVLELCPAAYRIATPTATVAIDECSAGTARVSMRGMYALADTHQVGIFEGAMEACGVEGTVLVQRHDDPGDTDFELSWHGAASRS